MLAFLCAFGILLCGTALAAEFQKGTLYVTLPAAEGIAEDLAEGIPSDAISMQEAGGKQYLFLPGNQPLGSARENRSWADLDGHTLREWWHRRYR